MVKLRPVTGTSKFILNNQSFPRNCDGTYFIKAVGPGSFQVY